MISKPTPPEPDSQIEQVEAKPVKTKHHDTTPLKAAPGFKPTSDMKKVLRETQQGNYGLTVKAACAKAEVTRRKWYRWLKRPQFSEWWGQERESYWVSKLSQIDKAAFEAATRTKTRSFGHADRKLFYERFDRNYQPTTRVEQESTHHVLTHIDSEGERLLRARLERDSED